MREYELDPADLGFARVATRELAVSDAMESRARVLEALENRAGPARDIVASERGRGVVCRRRARHRSREGVARAREVLASGAARAKLDHFVATTRRLAAR